MKLLHEEYTGLGQLLDELPSVEAMEVAASYFEGRDEDSFGLDACPVPSDHTIMTRFAEQLSRAGR